MSERPIEWRTFEHSRRKSGVVENTFDFMGGAGGYRGETGIVDFEWETQPVSLNDLDIPSPRIVSARASGEGVERTRHDWPGAALARYLELAGDAGVTDAAVQALPEGVKQSLAAAGGPAAFAATAPMQQRLDDLATSPLLLVSGTLENIKVTSATDPSVVYANVAWDAATKGHVVRQNADGSPSPDQALVALGVYSELTENMPNSKGRDAAALAMAKDLTARGVVEWPAGAPVLAPLTGGISARTDGGQHEVLAGHVRLDREANETALSPVSGARLEQDSVDGRLSVATLKGARETFEWPGAAVARYTLLMAPERDALAGDLPVLAEVVPSAEALVRGDAWGGQEALKNTAGIHTAINAALAAGLGVQDQAEDGSRLTLTNGAGAPVASFVFGKNAVTVTAEGVERKISHDMTARSNDASFKPVRELLEAVAQSDSIKGPRLDLQLKGFLGELSALEDMVRQGDVTKLAQMGARSLALAKTASALKEGFCGLSDRNLKPPTADWSKVVYWAKELEGREEERVTTPSIKPQPSMQAAPRGEAR